MELNENVTDAEPVRAEQVATPEEERVNELRRLTKFENNPSDLIAFLRRNIGQMIQDPIAGGIEIRESLVDDYNRFALDLGQAAGLLKDGTPYAGTPKTLVEGALGNLYGPTSVKQAFHEIAVRYIDGIIAGIKTTQ